MTKPESQNQFARYVTSTAFSISLSGPMIAALDHLAAIPAGEQSWSPAPVHWVSALAGLIRRGLAEREPNPQNPNWAGYPRITEPGRLVHQLCALAGLVRAADAAGRRPAA